MYGEFRRVATLPTWTETYCMSMEKCSGDLTLCIRGLSVCLSSNSFAQKTVTTPLWYPLCHIQCLKWALVWQYKVLLSVFSKFSGDLKPYFYSFSCHGYLQQGSWLEATINSVLSSLWQNCLQTDDLQNSQCLHSHWHTPTNECTHILYMWINLDWRTHARTQQCWQRNRDQCNLLQHKPKPLSSSICLSHWNRRNVWNQFCIQLRSSQPQQSGSRGDPESACMVLSGRLLWLIACFPLKWQNGKTVCLTMVHLSVQTQIGLLQGTERNSLLQFDFGEMHKSAFLL